MFVLQPFHLLVVILAGWINRHQQTVINFQNAQIQVMMEKLGKKRILLTDDQRRRLAVKGKNLGRKAEINHHRHSRYNLALASSTGG